MNEQALKERLRKSAEELKIPFNEVWDRMMLERFLVRLAISGSADKFILKGGSLLARYMPIGRETKDLDFLANRITSERAVITDAMLGIAKQEVDDGFEFDLDSVTDLEHDQLKYPGFNVRFNCHFSKMRGKISIDIGIGDDVSPIEKPIDLLSYSGKPIFEDYILLPVYPIESIFAEKLHTALVRGAVNSRMKDYHDMLSMVDGGTLEKAKVKIAIDRTFAARSFRVKEVRISFSDNDLNDLQVYWRSYIGKGKGKSLPADIREVIDNINLWLEK